MTGLSSQFPPSLSPAYTFSGSSVSGVSLNGKHEKLELDLEQVFDLVGFQLASSLREASAPSSPPHEADKVALGVQLGGGIARITRRGDPSSLLSGGCRKTRCFRVNHYTRYICSSILTDASRRVGFSLRRTHCKGNHGPFQKQVTH